DDLERGLVAEAGATRCPRVVGRAGGATAARVAAALVAAAVAAALAAAAEAAATAATGEAAAPSLGAGDLRRGVPHGRADLVDLQLHDVALLALAGLEGTLDQTTLRDHPHPLGEGLGDVLRSLAPDGAAHEESLTVLPLPCLRSEEHTSELQSRFDLVC